MRFRALGGFLPVGACALALAVTTAPAHAGTMTLGYFYSFGYSVEPPTGAVTPVGGFATLTVSASRATPSASFGFISGGTLLFLSLAGGPTHAASGPTGWTVGAGGGAYGAPGVAPAFLPSIMGSFFGLAASGMTFSPAGGFFFGNVTPPTAPPTANATVGNFNFAVGPFAFTGFLGIGGSGGPLSGSGSGGACFNAFAGSGPCATALGFGTTFVPSGPAPGTVPGFLAFGSEVSRSVAIEPVPEPGTALLLGLGLTGVAMMGGRRLRRR